MSLLNELSHLKGISQEIYDDRNLTKLSDADMIKIKLTFLPSWIDMLVTLRINQKLNKRSFHHSFYGNTYEIYCFDWDDRKAIPISFEEYVYSTLSFFAYKNGFKLI
jgi:hypothetical protein